MTDVISGWNIRSVCFFTSSISYFFLDWFCILFFLIDYSHTEMNFEKKSMGYKNVVGSQSEYGTAVNPTNQKRQRQKKKNVERKEKLTLKVKLNNNDRPVSRAMVRGSWGWFCSNTKSHLEECLLSFGQKSAHSVHIYFFFCSRCFFKRIIKEIFDLLMPLLNFKQSWIWSRGEFVYLIANNRWWNRDSSVYRSV